ncbi:hypothetical protein Tco_0574380 [Tanacetum coccineum]
MNGEVVGRAETKLLGFTQCGTKPLMPESGPMPLSLLPCLVPRSRRYAAARGQPPISQRGGWHYWTKDRLAKNAAARSVGRSCAGEGIGSDKEPGTVGKEPGEAGSFDGNGRLWTMNLLKKALWSKGKCMNS